MLRLSSTVHMIVCSILSQVCPQAVCSMCSAVLAQTSDIAELLTDYQIDLLRALEMSRLQFLREIGSLRPGTNDRQGSCDTYMCTVLQFIS